ncbi:hypothetical protein ABL78_7515 [Leptomonas seymouri]|uniref:Uncharacterized protein n=1 Tax=Leptomonas seymouri TaxID=5684 RepID=A0A0N1HTV6_LEPSE|nr:hypothetical protein ABL78_7515 [Leptomonas seymouri]|eukprot:KPI83445.1 hypothetical protein ABL78_7515 [Leptomonas seymouri]
MSSSTMRHRTHPPASATVAEGSGRARTMQGSPRQLHLCKELFFAGFPCQLPYQRPATAAGAAASAPVDPTPPPAANVRPLSKKFVRGFFQQYGAVEALFYDEARGIGSVVFADGADAQGCYLAVHSSFLPATTADGGVGQPTWEQDKQGEDLAERKARPNDLLLSLEFAHCCAFVNPVLLTKEVFVDGGSAHCEVPGAELSRATVLGRFPELLMPPSQQQVLPVAPHIVMRWRDDDEDGAKDPQASRAQQQGLSSHVEVIEDEDGSSAKEALKSPAAKAVKTKRVTQIGPSFPGRGIEPVEVEEALWKLLRPSHVRPAPNNVATVLDLWWEYYNMFMVHKTQPAESRIEDKAFRYARRPSLAEELLEVQRQSREHAHGDEAAAQQVMQRLVYDHVFHNVLCYLTVKQKFKYDPVWASLMRDLYKPKLLLKLEAWQALMEEKEAKKNAEAGEGAADAANKVLDSEVRRRRVVMKAIRELHEPQPTNPRDIEWVQRAEETWLTLPRTTAADNVMENVKFLNKVKRGEVDRSGLDKDLSKRPPLPTPNESGGEDVVSPENIQAAYPSMSARQRDAQFFEEVMQNLDGYVATGTAEELVAMCEDPKLFRYARGHIGYEEAHRQPSYWLAYINALWVPLIALLLMGFGSYYIVDRLGINKIHELQQQERHKREFHEHLRQLLEQQARMSNTTLASSKTREVRTAMKKINETMRKASEAAQKAGGKFSIQLQRDL